MAGDDVTLGEVYRLLQAQSADITEIKTDVKAQNGKVAAHETRIAVLEERSGTRGAVAGGFVGAAATAIAEAVRHWLTKP